MISEAVEREVKRLLETGGITQRGIARRIGVSRQTVANVKNRKPVEIRKAIKRKLENSLAEMEKIVGGRINRCPGCGALVYGECYECCLKKAKKERKLARVYNGPGESLNFDLSNDDASRLGEIRKVMRIKGDE
jgi:transcriptional regulator with XRE-family HTH domain